MQYAVSAEDVRAAAARLEGHAHRTPIVTCATLDRLAGRNLFFKCEHLQRVGAFKFRGAFNALARLEGTEIPRAVVTHSSGNHAQALALAARMRGIPAHIVMPSNASAPKRRAVEGYGATVIACEPNLPAREENAERVLAETGGLMVPPYDHPDIIAGQGTAALELLEDVPDLDAVIAPVGGGGLMAGTSVITRALRPEARLFAAEPLGADDAARSLASGKLVPQTDPRTVADGLLTSLGDLTWPVLRDHLEAVVTVREEEIVAAMRLAWERAKLLIEPSAAVTLAAVLSDGFRGRDGMKRVGVILSGGNVDLDRLPW
ncbi:MAG: pyridoxal-phosphate dependent enzyme [Gemmatimonadetes bacterium]|nr:pyridoxal-phosphate dependent enzyme [Gemmatimonadota bacterium]